MGGNVFQPYILTTHVRPSENQPTYCYVKVRNIRHCGCDRGLISSGKGRSRQQQAGRSGHIQLSFPIFRNTILLDISIRTPCIIQRGHSI